MITCVYAICFLKFVLKFHVSRPLLIGFLIAVLYLTFYREYYHYNTFTLRIFDYPLFPLLAWPLALTLLTYYMHMLVDVLKLESVWAKVAAAYLAYLMMLIFLEYTAYHYLNIRLVSNYSSLPFIDCLHTPMFMKFVYFINGLVFFILYFHLDLHRRTRRIPYIPKQMHSNPR